MDLSEFRACESCFDQRAHPLKHVLRIEREIRWSNIPREVRKAITVWCDEKYIPVVTWAKRALDQQVIIYQGLEFPKQPTIKDSIPDPFDAKEEQEVQRILERTKKVVENCPMFFQAPPRNRGLFGGIMNALGFGHG